MSSKPDDLEGFHQKSGPAAWQEQARAQEDAAAPEAAPDLKAVIGGLQDELAKMKDQAMRALAEAENTRKRAERDREDATRYAVSNFARDLLAVADNFRRALDAAPADLRGSDGRIDNLLAGIEATERELLKIFERFGIRRIATQDEMFNPNLHEVMFEIEQPGVQAGTIIQLIEPGYTIHDRLLRPARVGVAKGSPGTPGDLPPHALDTSA